MNKKYFLIGFWVGLSPFISLLLISVKYNPNEEYIKYMLENDKKCITYKEMQEINNGKSNQKKILMPQV